MGVCMSTSMGNYEPECKRELKIGPSMSIRMKIKEYQQHECDFQWLRVRVRM